MMEAASTSNMYDLELSQRLRIIKSAWATSHVKWLNGEKTNISRTISVLVLRVLKKRTEMVLEPLVFSAFNHLMQLVARADFIIHL
jgi:hypothetical protein